MTSDVKPLAPEISKDWKLRYRKIEQGSEADKLEAGTEILKRVVGHLEDSRRELARKFSPHRVNDLRAMAELNITMESLRDAQDLYDDAERRYRHYRYEHFHRFRLLSEPSSEADSMNDTSYG